ncbi:hypothetical protein JZU71_01590, partial [bacterium]|nr:hypothetical protein [bacterium]
LEIGIFIDTDRGVGIPSRIKVNILADRCIRYGKCSGWLKVWVNDQKGDKDRADTNKSNSNQAPALFLAAYLLAARLPLANVIRVIHPYSCNLNG